MKPDQADFPYMLETCWLFLIGFTGGGNHHIRLAFASSWFCSSDYSKWEEYCAYLIVALDRWLQVEENKFTALIPLPIRVNNSRAQRDDLDPLKDG